VLRAAERQSRLLQQKHFQVYVLPARERERERRMALARRSEERRSGQRREDRGKWKEDSGRGMIADIRDVVIRAWASPAAVGRRGGEVGRRAAGVGGREGGGTGVCVVQEWFAERARQG
jgi:hypothetical protein